MSTNDSWSTEAIICAVLIAVIVGMFTDMHFYERGQRLGACVEMCRPAKFDDAQEVNGGCLCIGSDKVLRFKKAP